MKRNILFVFLLLPIYIYSQFFQTGVQSEIPPLPESAVFRQFAGYTPSLNTGAANVPISLYDIQVGNFTLPISLQYYTSGIKVEAPADPVGYGWSLNPGLRITRTVRGRADEAAFKKVMFSSIDTGEGYNEFFYAKRAMLEYPTRTQEDIDFDRIIGTNTVIDTKYDLFTIHLPSGNHTFIYINEDRIESINPLLKIKAIVEAGRIVGFDITDEKGINYYFGCYRGENHNTTPAHVEKPSYSKGYYTAWGLRKITMPDGNNEINITWGKAQTKAYLTFPYQTKVGYMDLRTGYSLTMGGDPDSHERPPRLTTSENFYEPEAEMVLRIQEIEFPMGKMTFTYTNQNYKSILSSIVVKNNVNENIKNIKLEYDTNNTLLLTKLSITGEGIYKFYYNPNRFTNIHSQDFWGFYNGKPNQGWLVPNFKVGVMYYPHASGQPTTEYIYQFGYADRSVDRNYMQANLLTKVEYPTGGYTEFEYEPHIFQEKASTIVKEVTPLTSGKGLRVSKITTKADASSLPIIKIYKYFQPLIYEYISTYDSFFDRYLMVYNATNTNGGPSTTVARNTNIHAHSFLSTLYISNPLISYGSVEEYANDAHKTLYEFTHYSMDDVSMEPRPYVHSYRNISGDFRPMTKKVSYKKEGLNYIPIEEINYTYGQYHGYTYQETHADFRALNTADSDHEGHFLFYVNTYYPSFYPGIDSKPYYIFNTNLSLRDTYLSEEERITYMDSNEVTEKTEYTYNENRLLSKKTMFSSGNQEITEEYSYLGNTAYPTLTSRTANEKTENKRFDYHSGTSYQLYNISLYKDQLAEVRATYHNYNSYGKPVYVTTDGATKTVYIWSYKGQYPIAEIKNATYNEVRAKIPVATLDAITDAYIPTTEQLNLVNNLRLELPEALVSTYAYQPLVGLKSATDPSGLTTYYSYHNDGRLAEIYIIRDGAKISIERYDYNLVNPSTN